MRSLVILFAGVFSFFYIDLNFFRKMVRSNITTSTISIEVTDHKRKRKHKKRKYQRKKYKKKKQYPQKRYHLTGTNAKDKRYSNQKLLRRMYRND